MTAPTLEELQKRLRDIAAGARSKASLIASGSPTAAYADPVQILRALAKEAEDGLAPDPYAGMNTLEGIKALRQRLVAYDASLTNPTGDDSLDRPPMGDDYNRLFNLMEDGLRTLMRRLDAEGLEIQRTLVVSTAHLPQLHLDWLHDENRCNDHTLWSTLPTASDPDAEPSAATLIVDPIGDYGWRICVTDAVDKIAACVVPEDPLLNLLRFAEAHNCDWLAIDRDGPTIPDLPTFED